MTRTTRTTITGHKLSNVVYVRGAIYYQDPTGGPRELLVSAAELNQRRMTQDRWIREQKQQLAEAGPDRGAHTAPPATESGGSPAEATTDSGRNDG